MRNQYFLNVASQALGRFCSAGTNLIISIAIARVLGADVFGQYSYVITTVGIAMIMAELGTTAVLSKDLAQVGVSAAQYWGNFILLRIGLSVLTILIAIAGGYFVRHDLFGYVLLCTLFLPFLASRFVDPVFQVYKKPWFSLYASASYALIYFVGSMVALFAWKSLWPMLLVFVGSNVIYTVVSFSLTWRVLKPKFAVRPDVLKRILTVSAPLAVSALFTNINSRADIFMLSSMKSDLDVGIYAAAYRCLDLVGVMSAVLINPILPILAGDAVTDRWALKQRYAKLTELVALVALPVAILVPYFSPLLIEIVYGPSFAASAQVLNILAWVGVLFFFSLSGTAVCLSVGVVRHGYWNAALAACVNVALNLYLIPKYSYLGSAWATLISEICMLSVCQYFVLKSLGRIFSNWLWAEIIGANLLLYFLLKVYSAKFGAPLAILLALSVYLLVTCLPRIVTSAQLSLRLRNLRRSAVKGYIVLNRVIEKLRDRPAHEGVGAVTPEARQRLSELVVVITGSSRGIGLAIAGAFADSGASVVINGRDRTSLDQALVQLRERRGRVIAVAADLAQPEGAATLIASALGAYGKIDVLINNAGQPGPMEKRIWELRPDEWQSLMGANVSSAFHCSAELIRWASDHRHHARIINVSSGVVGHGAPGLGAYTVSKEALEGLTISIAADCSDREPLVSVLSIRPRSVRTGMTKGFYSAAEYAMMDAPEVLAPIFLYAASAPVHEIQGKSLSEPAFSADPAGEIKLSNRYSAVQILRPTPEYLMHDLTQQDHGSTYMHLLQNPIGHYAGVAQAIGERIHGSEIHGYPDPHYSELRRALSRHHDLDPSCFSFGPGASELLDRSLRTFSNERGNIIITKPTWGWIWPFLLKYGLHPVEVPHLGSLAERNLRYNLDGILRAININTRVVYIVNPCNPTGSIIDKDDLKSFLQAVPRQVTVILDEAYLDFAEPGKRFNLASCLNQFSCSVIGLRTFSKFHAMAGFRIGYAYGKAEVMNFLDRAEVPFNVSNIAQAAAVAALMDRESQRRSYLNNQSERTRIAEELEKQNIDFMPSQTNFVLFDCPLGKARMREALKKEGLFMPNIDHTFVENYTIMTVGLPEHNRKILDFLSNY